MAESQCEGCLELSAEVAGLKAFIAEWFTVLLQRFDSHDRNMQLLLNGLLQLQAARPRPASAASADSPPSRRPSVDSPAAEPVNGRSPDPPKPTVCAPAPPKLEPPERPPVTNGASPALLPQQLKKPTLLIRKEPPRVIPSSRIEARFVTADNTCMKCGNKFRYRSNAFRHVKVVHLMDMKHKCPYCDKTFRWKEAIKRHVRAMHPAHVNKLPAILAYFGANENNKFDAESRSIQRETTTASGSGGGAIRALGGGSIPVSLAGDEDEECQEEPDDELMMEDYEMMDDDVTEDDEDGGMSNQQQCAITVTQEI